MRNWATDLSRDNDSIEKTDRTHEHLYMHAFNAHAREIFTSSITKRQIKNRILFAA